jgi:excinuclease ABC subunit B
MNKFKLKSNFKPAGDQPKAIKSLLSGLGKNYRDQVLHGVTGSGKTFTMANIIEKIQKPTLIISHNKTLAAQLYGEFKSFFPENAIHYFVSYYDYYQPEAYMPHTDTYIEKEATINEEIDRLRHAATQSLLNRKDVLIVASVSCIYGLGSKDYYTALSKHFFVGQVIKRNTLLKQLIEIQYERNDIAFYRGQFRVKGDKIDIHLATGEGVIRIEMFGDLIEKIYNFTISPSPKNPVWASDLKNKNAASLKEVIILPAKHFMTPYDKMQKALKNIRSELNSRLLELKKNKKEVEAYRLKRKTNYDLEMFENVGYCNGIENYSRHLSGRKPGQAPETLMDFFDKDYLLFIDESHVTIPQIRGMHAGDQARKNTLIDFGFRLPSAKDNRPLNFKEFNSKINKVIYISATPSQYEIKKSKQVVEQIIRPTGLLDPKVEIRFSSGEKREDRQKKDNITINPSKNNSQIQDLIEEIKKTVQKKQRVLVTTLTKRMAEELSEYLRENKIKVQYLHSEIDTLERVGILKDLRTGKYDCLVGINLLREGLDLPEVSLVAILDADIGGFLRHETALMQTMGRAARHSEGRVIMYGNRITDAMQYAVEETRRRRKKQTIYNKKYNIKPKTIKTKPYESMI